MTRSTRAPNQWANAQHAFHESYNVDSTTLPRWDAWYRLRFVENDDRSSGSFLHFVAATHHLFGGHPDDFVEGDHAQIALWPLDAEPGERAPLWFEADGFDCQGLPHAGQAAIVGEPVVNGALCVEVGDRTIWPIYNPQQPIDWKRGWY